MLFCSHDLREIERFCPRTLWLEKGKLEAFGPTGDVLPRYKGKHGFPLEETDRGLLLHGRGPDRR
jgi:ABC-type polysaccharide/polyol phosphate transport system ATPase subunit